MSQTGDTAIGAGLAPAAFKDSILGDKTCRTISIGSFKGFATCLNKGLGSCPYRKPFGYGHLCYHPQWQDFAVKNAEAKTG